MKRKLQKNWTAEEIELLTDLYPSTSNKELADRLDRDIRSIANKAAHLKLQSKSNIKSKGAGLNLKVRSNLNWSESQTNLLLELFPNTSDKIIAERIGKNASQVRNKARYLKLYKSENFKPDPQKRVCALFRKSDDIVEKVKVLYSGAKNKEIAAEVGCGINFIRRVAKLFGLKKSAEFRQNVTGKTGVRKAGNIVRHHGYLEIYCGQRRYEKLHLHNWRKHHGEIPAKHFVTFKDGNRDNCDISNLELVSCAELHQRKRESHLPEHLRPLLRFTQGFNRIIAKKKKLEFFKNNSSKSISEKFWTPEKLEQFKQLYGSTHKQAIAEIFGITLRTVYNKAAALNLPIESVWTKEKTELLKEIYPVTNADELSLALGILKKSIKSKAYSLSLRKKPQDKGERTYIQKGRRINTQNNKLVYLPKYDSHAGLYKDIAERNGLSGIGEIRRKEGFFEIKTAENQSYTRLHLFIWMQHHGEIPEKHLVTFKDGNPGNCWVENLELITNSEMRRRNTINAYPEELQSTVAVLLDLKQAIKTTPRKSTRYTVEKTHATWSDEELAFLKANYTRLNNAQLAVELKRHPDAIAAKKTRLGLRVTNNGGGRRKKGAEIWTPERLERLKENYSSRLAREIAKEFGCSAATIASKAQKLGIGKGRGRRGSGTYKKYSIGGERTHSLRDFIEVKTENGWKRKQTVIWEKVNGNVPKGGYIAFKDGNRLNFDINNLQLRSHAELNRQKLGIGTPDCLIDVTTGLDLFKLAITSHPDYVAIKKGDSPRSWSNEELNYLQQSYGLAKRSEIAKKLGRSVQSVLNKASKMKLTNKTGRSQQVHI